MYIHVYLVCLPDYHQPSQAAPSPSTFCSFISIKITFFNSGCSNQKEAKPTVTDIKHFLYIPVHTHVDKRRCGVNKKVSNIMNIKQLKILFLSIQCNQRNSVST